MAMDFKPWAAAGCVRPVMHEDVIFMIATHNAPTLGPLLVLHETQTLKRTRTTIDDVSGYNDRIGLPGFYMSRHRL
jgi:hypothetical protein